ncbi:isochorismatase family protein [Streptomyces enissocaesilis]|uniref:Isochorismatase-like domain-containing protein n=1 Tax=Streptomyces enissocaesilis TaxID=332589 RepID=A0ABN3X8S0_9ACTN
MSLPAITPYPMPAPEELPANKVDWPLDPRRAALLIHDMQDYFLAPFTPGKPPLTELLTHIIALRQACARHAVPVVYSAQPGGQSPDQRGLLQDFWGDGIPDDPYSTRVTPALTPTENDIRLTKWRYSAFVRTDLADQLAAAGRDQLIISGIYAHIGCLTTACDAFMRDIQPFLIADAVADFTPAHHTDALTYAAQRCATVTTTHSVLTQFAQRPVDRS